LGPRALRKEIEFDKTTSQGGRKGRPRCRERRKKENFLLAEARA